MFDTVHVEVPRLVEYSRNGVAIVRDLDRLEAEGKSGGWRVGGAKSPYRRTANLEPYGLPIILHQSPRWNQQGGDKIEFTGAGAMRVSQMAAAGAGIYRFNLADAAFLRLDCTADVKEVPVDWFRDHTRFKYKIKGREYGTWSKHRRAVSETLYGGDKPNQWRIYDKTGERQYRLQQERRKVSKAERDELTFESLYGMSPNLKVTRVERQMGDRSPAKVYGVKYFGDIAMMAGKPVFENMIFPETARVNLKGLKGEDELIAEFLLEYKAKHGLQDTLSKYKRHVSKRTFARKYKLFEGLLHASPDTPGITLAALTERYRVSSLVQLAA
jgi:hypothetical protein